MDGELTALSERQQALGTMSWTAYVRPVLTFVIIAVISVTLIVYSGGLGVLGLIVAFGRLIYDVLFIRSVRLFQDQNGVWLFRGILPWSKGTVGVKWRDLDEARYATGLTSWMFKSYDIRIGHRFTKSAEIRVDHLRQGDKVAQGINSHHQKLVAEKALN